MKRKSDDESYIIVKHKALQNSFVAFAGEWSGRGDYIKTPLDINDDNLQKILHSLQSKLAKLDMTEVIKEKMESDFSETLQYALYTEHVKFAEKSYVPRKVVHINRNILKWLAKDPVELGWIPYEDIKAFFENLDAVIEVIKESKDFKYYNQEIEEEFGYQLVVKQEDGSLWLTCRKVRTSPSKTIKKQ